MMKGGSENPAGRAEHLAELESLLRYRFRDRKLLERSLTHRSYANENEGQGLRHNESMEFLGDAVLGFVISACIFNRFPNCSEGELSKMKAYLVSAVNLAHMASEIRLGDFLFLSRDADKTGLRTKRAIVVDAYEALLGAIYLDGGIEAAEDFLERQLGNMLDTVDVHHLSYGDFKSSLQEQLHKMGKPEPVYRVVDEIGPDHRKMFVVELIISEQVVSRSSGRSKKEAQQEAARLAIEKLA